MPGRDYDLTWNGNYFEKDIATGDLLVIVPHHDDVRDKDILIGEQTFRHNLSKETEGCWDDPIQYAREFHDTYPMATADNVRIASSLFAITVYATFQMPLDDIDAYARALSRPKDGRPRLPRI